MFQVETDSVGALYKRSLELDCTLKELDCELSWTVTIQPLTVVLKCSGKYHTQKKIIS